MSLSVDGLGVAIRSAGTWVPAVTDVSFDVAPGELVGLAGESGSGKSLTGLAIMGLLNGTARREAGTIEVAGTQLAAPGTSDVGRARREGLAMVFQNPMTSLNPSLTIGEQIAEAAELHDLELDRDAAWDRACDLLGLVEIRHPTQAAERYPHEFSGGMQQRAMIAMAVACRPKVLIADEPTTALDVTVQKNVMDLLQRLRTELGLAILLVSHDLALIGERCDRVLVMYAGELVESGEAREVLTAPSHPYVSGLIAATPSQALATGALEPLQGRVPRPGEALAAPCRFAARCALAVDRCRVERPALVPAHGQGWARCHRAGERMPIRGAAVVPSAVAWRDRAAAAEGEHVLSLNGLTRRFAAVTAVDDVTLAIADGESLGLVGESGSGKSTLGRMICGLIRPDTGTITVGSSEVSARGAVDRELWRTVQLVFQDPYSSLNPKMRVRSIVGEPSRLWGHVRKADVDGHVGELLELVGLDERVGDALPATLSGGQRQRVSIARALAARPRLIVFDEAVSSLDVSVQAQILALLQRLRAEHGLSYLFISHDLSVVRVVCDRVAVMLHGRIVETCDAAALTGDRAHDPYTERLLGAVPRMPVATPGAMR